MNWLGTGEPMAESTPCRLDAKPKSSAAKRRPDRVPLAEDDGGQRDVAGACRHLPVEARDRDEGEVGAAEAGDRAREQDRAEAGAVDLDADRVGGLGVLADGADAQAPAGAVEGEGHDRDRDVQQVDDRGLAEEDRTDQRDVAQDRDRHPRASLGGS